MLLFLGSKAIWRYNTIQHKVSLWVWVQYCCVFILSFLCVFILENIKPILQTVIMIVILVSNVYRDDIVGLMVL